MLSAEVMAYLRDRVGVGQPWPMVSPRLSEMGAPRLGDPVLASLRDLVGAEHVHTDAESRWRSSPGASYLDYVALRGGEVAGAPDAVVWPADHDQVQRIMTLCSTTRTAVVPVGGGTSVVGGLRGDGPRLAVHTGRLRAVRSIDPISRLVSVDAGITGPQLEAILSSHDLSLGHLPQSWERASIGGYLATRSAGQASTGYGRSDDMVQSLRMATPLGTWDIGLAPASAAGPDLLQVALGSEGALGIITGATLRVRTRPAVRRYEAWMLPSFAVGENVFRALAQAGETADVMRLSDEAETATTMLMSAPAGVVGAAVQEYLKRRGIPRNGGALAILGWDGVHRADVDRRRGPAVRALRSHGAVALGQRPGRSWLRHRFEGPYLRDALMDAGYLVETVETATSWARLGSLRAAIHGALETVLTSDRTRPDVLTSDRTRPYVMTHVSHVYETGASLYTTVLAVADADDRVGQWRRAKEAVSEAIVAGGGTITHHHAIGRDHAPWLGREIGDVGMGILRAVKDEVDPHGICNPGVLIP
jgi:alkyldihydroxyacetonephosphate synthase